ncbi:MAG: hypothetical protein K2P48_01640 [Lachnospiraceae bacterium]|nr:hypothetical protein [Lachnospiraceae bacterium]
MDVTEVILIVVGVAIFLLGYFMPARKKDMGEDVKLIGEDEIRKLIAGEEEHIKNKVADVVEETVSYSIEKTERAMERLTNEKIMAINEYSDTVLEEIHKNHKEVVFLYDMLNDKHENLTSAVSEATQTAEGVRHTLSDAEITVHDAMDKADDVLRAVNEASARINDVLRAADDAVKGVWDAQNAARVAREAAQEAIRIASDLTGREAETKTEPGTEVKEEAKSEIEAEVKAEIKTEVKAKRSAIDVLSDMKASREMALEEIQQEQKPVITENVAIAEEKEFKPIAPKRVEIIHEPEEPEEEAVHEQMEEIQESPAMIDLPFTQDNGRNSNERILDLHKAGKSNMAIAKELGLGLGEVKLVIDLFEGM